jgi:endonuclease III
MTELEMKMELTKELLSFGLTISNEVLFPTKEPEAYDLIKNSPYAFLFALSLDRGTKAEIIWTIPYWMKNILGHLDPVKIDKLSIDELRMEFDKLPYKPRFLNAAPRTIKELTGIVVHSFNGDSTLIWESKSAKEVIKTFRRIYGIGPGIANLAILLIEKAYDCYFSDFDHKNMNIKPDVHTILVLYRLGVSKEKNERSSLKAAMELNPNFPGDLDKPLWVIGKNWCHANSPKCSDCPVEDLCLKKDL